MLLPRLDDRLDEQPRAAKLTAYGIAPPSPRRAGPVALTLGPPRVGRAGPPEEAPACPLCGSPDTEQTARFASTACKSLWRCLSCREPFDQFKTL